MQLLSVNAGSSSLKLRFYELRNNQPVLLISASAEHILTENPVLNFEINAKNERKQSQALTLSKDNIYHDALLAILELIKSHYQLDIQAVGHRIVHGGGEFYQPVAFNDEVLERLSQYKKLAPLHQPMNLLLVEIAMKLIDKAVHVACFDTAFHHEHSPLVSTYGLPKTYTEQGIRAYGFHGLSCQAIMRQLAAEKSENLNTVIAHLGSGASVTAVKNAKSISTSMGFTASEGLIMSTRAGQIDPGVIFYLARQGKSLDDIEHLLNKQSGLLGLSGKSANMVDLLNSDGEDAQFAVQAFCYKVAKNILNNMTLLGNLEQLVFTAGIGERSPEIRTKVCQYLAWMGLVLDEDQNQKSAKLISHPNSKIKVKCLQTDEELEMAYSCLEFI